MLLDIMYVNGNAENEYTDNLYIVYKDLSTGEKKLYTIDKPEIDIYFTKEEYRDYDYNKIFLELEKVNKVSCKYKGIPWTIANEADGEYKQALQQFIEKKEFQSISKMHMYPYVFGSDIPIETFYRTKWLLECDNDRVKIPTKQFLDIEVDGIDIEGFPEPGSCPINAVTLVDEPTKTVHTFLLENDKNPQIKEFKENLDSFIAEVHEAFDESYGVFDYKIYMYPETDELEMIRDIFRLINTLKTDFLLIWNAPFDIPFIISRLEYFGVDPKDVICHRDFKNKVCRFKKDTKNFAVASKSDAFIVSSYTKYLDQMILYAATRKGQSELRSFTLNNIGKLELEDEKIDYSEEANIKTFPYVNYRKFVLYNIKDVMLQYGIEKKVDDIDNLYLRSYLNCTPYDHIFKQTVMLKARAYYEFLLQGLIIGNNINIYISHGDSSFSGAYVADPLLNDFCGIVLFNERSMFIFDDVIDFDFSAMYPHIIITFNIERNCLIGKLIISDERFSIDRYIHGFDGVIVDNSIKEKDDSDDEDDETEVFDDKYDPGTDFVDNYLVGDVLSFCNKWFNLPDIVDIDEEFRKEMSIKPTKRFSIKKNMSKLIDKITIKIR